RITLIPAPYEKHKYTRRAMLRDFQRVFMNLRGLATVIYPTPDLAHAKDWYAKAFGVEPYFDQPFYVGFEIAGYELGLLPDEGQPGPQGGVAYWRVDDISSAMSHFLQCGATMVS